MNDAFSKRGGMLLSSLCIVLIIHVVPSLAEFLFVVEVSLVQKYRCEKVCSSRLIRPSLHWCLIGFWVLSSLSLGIS